MSDLESGDQKLATHKDDDIQNEDESDLSDLIEKEEVDAPSLSPIESTACLIKTICQAIVHREQIPLNKHLLQTRTKEIKEWVWYTSVWPSQGKKH